MSSRLTGTIAVLEGSTRSGRAPSMMPDLSSACANQHFRSWPGEQPARDPTRGETRGPPSSLHGAREARGGRRSGQVHGEGCVWSCSAQRGIPYRGCVAPAHLFCTFSLDELDEGEPGGRIGVTADAAVEHTATVHKEGCQLSLCHLRTPVRSQMGPCRCFYRIHGSLQTGRPSTLRSMLLMYTVRSTLSSMPRWGFRLLCGSGACCCPPPRFLPPCATGTIWGWSAWGE